MGGTAFSLTMGGTAFSLRLVLILGTVNKKKYDIFTAYYAFLRILRCHPPLNWVILRGQAACGAPKRNQTTRFTILSIKMVKHGIQKHQPPLTSTTKQAPDKLPCYPKLAAFAPITSASRSKPALSLTAIPPTDVVACTRPCFC